MDRSLHPMLIVFPFALLATSFIFDMLYLFTGDATWTSLATWLIAGGVLSGLAAAFFGVRDWLTMPSGSDARRIGFWHGVGNSLLLLFFVVSFWLRYQAPGAPLAIAISPLAMLTALPTAWLGAELAGRLREGAEGLPEAR